MPDNVKRFLDWKRKILPKGAYTKYMEIPKETRLATQDKHGVGERGSSVPFARFVHEARHQTEEGFDAAIDVVRRLHASFKDMGLDVPEWTEAPEWLDG